jgi:YfiR/HmsC-like
MAMGILKFMHRSLAYFTFTRHSPWARNALMRLAMKLFVITLVLISLPVNADEVSREYRIKAAFIYNFTKFVLWPQQDSYSDSESFKVCILGDDRLTAAASSIQGKSVHGKVLQIKSITNAGENGPCEIMFLAISNTEQLQQVLDSIKGASILSVGDNSDFVDNGGIIGLFVENNKVKFNINQLAAGDNGLKINSRLLELANRVIQ